MNIDVISIRKRTIQHTGTWASPCYLFSLLCNKILFIAMQFSKPWTYLRNRCHQPLCFFSLCCNGECFAFIWISVFSEGVDNVIVSLSTNLLQCWLVWNQLSQWISGTEDLEILLWLFYDNQVVVNKQICFSVTPFDVLMYQHVNARSDWGLKPHRSLFNILQSFAI